MTSSGMNFINESGAEIRVLGEVAGDTVLFVTAEGSRQAPRFTASTGTRHTYRWTQISGMRVIWSRDLS